MLSELLSNPTPPCATRSTKWRRAATSRSTPASASSPTSTLIADTAALQSGTTGNDGLFTSTEARLQSLLHDRDALATQMKDTLTAAAFSNRPIPFFEGAIEIGRCTTLLARAGLLS